MTLPFLLEVEGDKCKLPGNLYEMAQFHIYMPHDLQIKVLLLVVDGRDPDDAIHFLHE